MSKFNMTRKRSIIRYTCYVVIVTFVIIIAYQMSGISYLRQDRDKVNEQGMEENQITRLREKKQQREKMLLTSKDMWPIDYLAGNITRITTDTTNRLYSKVRILCWVLTQPSNLEKRAKHVRRTWGRRCTKLLFFSSIDNDTFPAIGVGIEEEGRKYLTIKTLRPFRYVYKHYFNDFDWFLKTDDDAYVIMENLRYFLSAQDTNKPIYFGHKFKTYIKSGWFSGGPGIVLSKEALRRFGEAGLEVCPEPVTAAGDLNLGRCMEKINVTAGESLDSEGKNRFFCLNPENHAFGGYPGWYYKYDAHGAKSGIDSMSDYAIAFHYVKPGMMYLLEYALYHLRPYGIHLADKELNVNETGTILSR